jgi:hypothetical protein
LLEFLGGIADAGTDDSVVRLAPSLFQPVAAEDVAAVVAEVAFANPRNGIVEIAGPERAPFNEIVTRYLKAIADPREVVKDPEARYFGGRLEEKSLVPLGEARFGLLNFEKWLRLSQKRAGSGRRGSRRHFAMRPALTRPHKSTSFDEQFAVRERRRLCRSTSPVSSKTSASSRLPSLPVGQCLAVIADTVPSPSERMIGHLFGTP